jgi:hypothetical protein
MRHKSNIHKSHCLRQHQKSKFRNGDVVTDKLPVTPL